MILLIDNYDSFSYNLYHCFASYDEVQVARNDEIDIETIKKLDPALIVLSPGPGRPEDAGICIELIQQLYTTYPIFGVCLGHQAIALALGGEIGYAKEKIHGKAKTIQVTQPSPLFENIDTFEGGRYHSLAITKLPEHLKTTSICEEEIMSIEHTTYPLYGVQFHPESILSPQGTQIIANLMKGIQS
ncbi:anthranilate synthase component II [Dubosiella newyorkensis]|uniref:anthranilate synthase component II n=1 Tax=Dubosiella newyorkensis TaxID=1862672 RepID=UPI00272A285C|nr:aminodeoxychorismate/anthranilate synthase component II [Dubosiella newyorkensis]